MDPKHKDLLVRKRAELVENLNMRDGLFTQLISRKILNQRMVRTIQHNRTPDQQAEELLNVLPTRGPEAFQAFCDALNADFQEEVVKQYLTVDSEPAPAPQSSPSPASGASVQEERTPPVQQPDAADCLPSLKRPRPTSPQTLVIWDGSCQRLAKLQPLPPPPQAMRLPVMERGGVEDDGTFSRHTMKHYILEDQIPFMQNMFAARDAGDREVFLKHAASNGASVYVQHAQHSPSKLLKQDSIDTMTKGSEGNSTAAIVSVQPKPAPIIPTHPNWDDADIDLTDGPVIVNVQQCTRQFYLANYKKAYEMRRIPRGHALIINVNEVEGKPPRRGTNIDCNNLNNLLQQLQFVTHVYNDADDLSSKGFVEKLQEFAALPGHKESDCAIVCLLSHGEEGFIYSTDGRRLSLEEIFLLFSNNNCKHLIGKPKIFIIQACRGGNLDRGVGLEDEIDGDPGNCRKGKMPTMSDMLVCFPTQNGYYAWRNRERGSWYIEAIVKIFMRHAKNEDICAMLNRVNQLVSRKVSSCVEANMDKMCQMSEYKSTLRKPYLFFFPGIGFPNSSSA